jgi:type I restriction enzyme R subunit
LDELRKLIQEIGQARQQRDDTELSPEAFAVYWLLQRDGITQAGAIAQAAGEAFAAYPHWAVSSHQEQGVRRALYKALIDAGVSGVADVAQHLLKMLKRATE